VKAFRLRHRQDLAPDQGAVRTELRRRGQLAAHTVYECECGERYLGQQQCDVCHRFCRAVGLGGRCPGCDEVVLLVDLLDDDLTQLLLDPARGPA